MLAHAELVKMYESYLGLYPEEGQDFEVLARQLAETNADVRLSLG